MRKYINQQEMRRGNAADIFALIREHPGITRKQIEQTTEFSWGAVSNITSLLVEKGYVTERKARAGAGAGRTPQRLFVNGDRRLTLGIDVNRAGLSAALLNLNNEPRGVAVRGIDSSDAEIFQRQIEDFTEDVMRGHKEAEIGAVGVAMQGVVDAAEGVSVSLPDMDGWRDVPLAARLSERFGVPVYLEHDPDCILYAHSRQNEVGDALLIRADSGIGMSVMLDGRIKSRPGMYEIGHICVSRNGPECACGKRGCLETYASMRGLERQSGLSYAKLKENAAAGDAAALRLFGRAARLLGKAVGDVAGLLNIRDILLYGELWDAPGDFREIFISRLTEYVQSDVNCRVLEPGGAAVGAAMIAAERELDAARG